MADISIEHRTQGGWDVLDVAGEVDLSSAQTLRASLVPVIEGGTPRLLVNLQNVRFMDSSGLSVLVSAMKGVRETGGVIALACANESILKVFAITGLDRLFSIHGSVSEAIAS